MRNRTVERMLDRLLDMAWDAATLLCVVVAFYAVMDNESWLYRVSWWLAEWWIHF